MLKPMMAALIAITIALSTGTAFAETHAIAGSWILESIRGGSVIAEVKSTMELAEDGAVSGSGGCNRMFGKATIDGASITFGNIASTRMACPQENMDQEQKYFTTLGIVREWRVDPTGAKLVLLDDKGEPVLTFARQ